MTVRAAGAVRLLALPALDFLGLIDTQPTFAQALAIRSTPEHGPSAAVGARQWRATVG